jgi:EAL domain-containing protein (putative c-di-GMP-specific phosphodiesterase class I)
VNIAVAQLQTPDFAATVADVLERSGLPPQCLILEITERTFVDDMSSARAVLHRLQSLGVRIAIDDFGTGFSALKYLNELPVDILKVDRDFVAKISADPEESALARALIQLAHTMHLGVIAEGIESAAQADELRARGCQFGQGFHYAHPVPADVISTLLASQHAPSPALDTH